MCSVTKYLQIVSRGETVTLHIRKNTQKSKFLLSQAFKWKKVMFFVIPKMPSKTFVMVQKKFPGHFKSLTLILNREIAAYVIDQILPLNLDSLKTARLVRIVNHLANFHPLLLEMLYGNTQLTFMEHLLNIFSLW